MGCLVILFRQPIRGGIFPYVHIPINKACDVTTMLFLTVRRKAFTWFQRSAVDSTWSCQVKKSPTPHGILNEHKSPLCNDKH